MCMNCVNEGIMSREEYESESRTSVMKHVENEVVSVLMKTPDLIVSLNVVCTVLVKMSLASETPLNEVVKLIQQHYEFHSTNFKETKH